MITTPGRSDAAPDSADEELNRLRTENQALRSRLDIRAAVRTWLALVLVVLASLSVVTATVAVWAHNEVFDTERFMETVEPALEDPAFYSALSTRLSEQTLEALDLENRVSNSLAQLDEYLSEALVGAIDPDPRVQELLSRFERPSLTALAPGIAETLEARIVTRIDGFITSDEFEPRFLALVRQAHEAAVALLRDDRAELPNVYVQEGEVRLNLIPLVTESLQRVGDEVRGFLPDLSLPDAISDRVDEGRAQLGEALQAQLPEDFGQLTIMSQADLTELQEGAQRLDQLVWALLILAMMLLVLSVVVSPTRRRTLIQLGIGVAVGLVVGWVIVRRLQESILAQIANPDGEQAARALLSGVASSLRNVALLVGISAIVIAVAAYLTGRPRWIGVLSERTSRLTAHASRGSGLDRWLAAHQDMMRIVGVVIATLALYLTGIHLIALLIIGVLLALYLWAIAAAGRHKAALQEPDHVGAGT